jgi:enoyl-CoA hydratase/carnithine racemase
MAGPVQVEVDDGVATIRLDRPPMNALNVELIRELQAAGVEATEREDVGAIVLWGGEKVFAAGADVKMMSGMSPRDIRPIITAMQDAFNAFEEIPKVTVAAINGYCLGGGCELAMCADLRVAGQGARLGQPEILLGVIPGAGGTQRLPRLVGLGRAKELIYSGRFVEADEALRIGLVHRVVPDGEVLRAAVEEARRYSRGPRVALRAAKVAATWGGRGEFRAGLVLERELFADLFSTDDAQVGMRSLLEQGPGKATFSGR